MLQSSLWLHKFAYFVNNGIWVVRNELCHEEGYS
jgi:hypothetical protein